MVSWPVSERAGVVDSGFRTPGRPKHAGWDIFVPEGTPVRSIFGGTIKRAGWTGGAGCAIHEDSGAGLSAVYMHLSALAVYAGDEVREGETIALTGDTGKSRGPHLHVGILATDAWIAANTAIVNVNDAAPAHGWPGWWIDPEIVLGAPREELPAVSGFLGELAELKRRRARRAMRPCSQPGSGAQVLVLAVLAAVALTYE